MAFKTWASILVPVVALGGMVFWRMQTMDAKDAEQKKEAGARRGAASSVEVATAQSFPIIESIETVGTVTPEFTVNIAPRVTGRIIYLEVREGEPVQPGQLLARIDPDQAEAGVLDAKARANESRSRLAQAQATVQANNIQIEQNVRQAQAEVANARANLTQVQRNTEARIATSEANLKEADAELVAAQAELKNRQAQVKAARATLDNAEAKATRLQNLYEKGFVSAADRDDANTARASAAANLEVRQGEVESAVADVNTAKARQASAVTNLKSIKASAEAEIEAAKARLDQARASLTSAEAGRAQIPANQANLEALRAGVDSAEAQVQSAAAQKSDTELRSTIAGTVTKRNADPGAIASPGSPVLVVESTKNLIINASVPIDQAGRIQSGSVARLTIDGLGSDSIQGRVERVVPSADPQDRQALVRIRISDQSAMLKPGMFAKVAIELRRTEAQIAIPKDAIQEGSVTAIGPDGKAVKKKVTVGESDANNAEILSGLALGDKVVVLSFSPVREGSGVTVSAERGLDGTRRVIEVKKPAGGPGGAQGGGSGRPGGGGSR